MCYNVMRNGRNNYLLQHTSQFMPHKAPKDLIATRQEIDTN